MFRTSEPSGRIMSNGQPARGRPVSRDQIPAALRSAGLENTAVEDVVAFIYPDLESFASTMEAERISSAEQEACGSLGNVVHGPFVTEDGILGFIDMTLAGKAGQLQRLADEVRRARRESRCYNASCLHQGEIG
jgi:hypothetical protein